MHTLICARCGAEFQHKNANVKTCSEKCRKARKRDQDILCKSGRSRTGQIEKCRYCGKSYIVEGTTQAFCSPKCRKANGEQAEASAGQDGSRNVHHLRVRVPDQQKREKQNVRACVPDQVQECAHDRA